MADFERLGVCPEIIQVLESQGWLIPTCVQDEAIPLILGGRDVCVSAETGSGKTGSFSIPCVQLVHETLRNKATCTVTRNFKDVNIIHENNYFIASSSVDRWSGFKVTDVVVQNSAMYEVSILSDGLVRVGWTTLRGSFELGKDDQSFGYGGSGKKSFNKIFSDYGTPFTKDDIVGCMIDRRKNIIQFSKNGTLYGPAFEIPQSLSSDQLFPGICGKLFKVAVRTAPPFRYPMQNFPGLIPKETREGQDYVSRSSQQAKHVTLCLILEPTRDLARQTYDVLQQYLLHLDNPKLSCTLLIGGYDDARCLSDLKHKGANIVVGSIGKVVHAMRSSCLDLSKLQYFVLDEADELISQNNDTKTLMEIKKATQQNNIQTLFFSATLEVPEVRQAIDALTKNATWINLKGPLGIPETVHFVAYPLSPFPDSLPPETKLVLPHIKPITDGIHELCPTPNSIRQNQEGLSQQIKILKPQIAVAIAEALCMDSCLIFCRTNLDCENFEAYLNHLAKAKGCYSNNIESGPQNPYSCAVLAGMKSQKERDENLRNFKKGYARFLICTDVAARGLDIDALPFVIMLSIPDNPSIFFHRVGRVGRHDKMGLAIAIVSQIKEKVWYHTCTTRGRNCKNTKLKEDGGCCIWYDDKQYLQDIEARLKQSVPRMNPQTFSVEGILEFHDQQVLPVMESEQEEWLSSHHDTCVESDSSLGLKKMAMKMAMKKPTVTIYGKSKALDSEKCAQAATLEIENSIREVQSMEQQAQKNYFKSFYSSKC